MEKDIFCKINEGEMPSDKVYEGNKLDVIMDKFPSAPGEMLIISKSHIKDIFDMDADTFSEIREVIIKMTNLVYDKLGAEGVTIVQNNGICQEIKHFHIHILPKYSKKISLTNEEIYKKLIEK